MKKAFSFFTLITLCTTLPIIANPAIKTSNSTIESQPGILAPDEITEKTFEEPSPNNYKSPVKQERTTAAAIIGTAATIAIGLLISGAHTGKHPVSGS